MLAGGTGSRLSPTTDFINKHLFHVYNKPMIFYPIDTLLKLGIQKITIVTSKTTKSILQNVLENHFRYCSFSIIVQNNSNGVVGAFLKAIKNLSTKEDVAVILGDNIFLGNLSNLSKLNIKDNAFDKSLIFTTESSSPSRFGVIKPTENNNFEIVEKPVLPPSNEIVTGLYIIKKNHFSYLEKVRLSKRGELEITDFNNILISKNKLYKIKLPKDIEWFDAGTHEDLFLASQKVRDLYEN
ncbi:sugar phosphate nucleotidyltransferase [Staphylococcus epidermidis]|uniref:sugar phosphate nucleotidyltransferase n=1 Tax=Staphylococcus epidermidis TaxID=1282 RepID=UPI00247FC1A6|nr:sugar phosphate nucleotidyltransferase [Staphylococcus epidermidis]MDH9727341.1 sugar phosphate nucleotidyltransferase [Staphylococcus epidermidis]MDH9729492.1 sugar phosphate nucleotidyltransferase [Staphylococcus epidermidis]MDH9781457.1 sugar phosphate nucleotidyltransferase [Staphylococcus epidermidis]MDH9791089.1 sugar phosphate nucleotidyltransferase [Staphylococcus epidermidis]